MRSIRMSPLITSFIICVRNFSPMERYHRVFVSSCLAFPADLKVPQVSYEEQGLKTWGFFKLSEECIIYYSLLIRRCDAFRTSKASSSPCLWCKCIPDTDIHALFSFQIEECAIQDLLVHYEAFDNPEEFVTVERAPQGPIAAPMWNKH